MHNLKEIRKDFASFKKALEKRSLDIDFKKLEDLDFQNRELIQKKELLEKEKKDISKSKDKSLYEKSKEISLSIEKISKKQKIVKMSLDEILSNIPNIPHGDVPKGKDDNDNVEIKKSGNIPKFDFKPKSHYELGEKLGMLDFDLATKTTGSRFVFVKNKLALLERAISNFMLDTHITKNGYEEISPPLLASENTMFGTGQLPKFEEDLFKTNFNDLYLIPTSEVPLTNLNRDSIIDKKHMPLKYTTYTNCFRAEAGASGTDTKGLMREHQFGKVELVTISEPEQSDKELNNMIICVENILKKLSIPYRIVELCSGDIGFSSSYTLDIEIWMPGQNKYREVSSCSNCTDFQSRRMKMRIKNFENGEIYYPHTLNGSSLAIGRLLISILENYQNEDGTIKIPSILKEYTNGLSIISNDKKI